MPTRKRRHDNDSREEEEKKKKKKEKEKTTKKPPPPPAPPSALVKLLKKDKKVLAYFTALQANLEYDVQKWKDRTAEWKQKYEEVQLRTTTTKELKDIEADHEERQEQEKQTIERETRPKNTELSSSEKLFRFRKKQGRKDTDTDAGNSEIDKSEDEESKKHMEAGHDGEPAGAKDIQETIKENDDMMDDVMADLSSSSSSSSSFDGHETLEAKKPSDENTAKIHRKDHGMFQFYSSDEEEGKDNLESFPPALAENPTDNIAVQKDDEANGIATGVVSTSTSLALRDFVLRRLEYAFHCLEELGVSAVHIEKEEERKVPPDGEAEGENEAPKCRYERLPDEDVAAELIQSIRACTRVQLQAGVDSTKFSPFPSLVPACDVIDQPSYEAKMLAFHALSIMDTYCYERTNVGEWDGLFPSDHSNRDNIKFGLKNRKCLVDSLVKSLHGEITEHWAMSDRTARLQSSALHFRGNNHEDEGALQDQDRDHETYTDGFGSKSQSRLSTLIERCTLCQILSHLHALRGDEEIRQQLLLKYLISNVPAPSVEDYPRLPPVLSPCTIEALLGSPHLRNASPAFVQSPIFPNDATVWKAIAVALHSSADIWKKRLESSDDRITDVSRVELASFERLKKCPPLATAISEEITDNTVQLQTLFQTDLSSKLEADQIVLLLRFGNKTTLEEILEAELAKLMGLQASSGEKREAFYGRILTCTQTAKQFELRMLDSYREKIGSADEDDTGLQRVKARLFAAFSNVFRTVNGERDERAGLVLTTAIQACKNLGDAELGHELLQKAISANLQIQQLPTTRQPDRMPVLRFINLRRRRDRRILLQTQALSQNVLLAKALPTLNCKAEKDNDFYWGSHAFDGIGSMLEVQQRLSGKLEVGKTLADYVAAQWQPSDLKAFDIEARQDNALVSMSPSERACALSHIASWKGALRSLRSHNCSNVLSSFRIGGYATGKALLLANEGMPPTPVCIILEDDAVLVDRFVDRLDSLLKELPRDFHFCSLGYSRPKTAPIVPFSAQIGVPSCIWYLTGYIVSLEGCQYLLESLPVRGPVDSWIGLLMCHKNWDNVYGQALGVGVHSRPERTVTQKELCQVLRFRAFAALVPLCHQRVNAEGGSVGGRSWRQYRDTDVTFSGHLQA